jgi:PilZ domain-containing protein
MTNRRSRPRYDVVGSLWGVLELSEEARVLNISTTGALVDSPIPCAVDSTQAVRLGIEGHDVTVDTRVRHVRPESSGSASEPRYFLGLEFISPPLLVLQSIEQMSANARSHTDAEGA